MKIFFFSPLLIVSSSVTLSLVVKDAIALPVDQVGQDLRMSSNSLLKTSTKYERPVIRGARRVQEEDEEEDEEEGSADEKQSSVDENKSADDNASNDDDSDDSAKKSKRKAPKARECKFDEGKDEVDFKCKAKTEDDEDDSEIKDQIEYKVRSSKRGISIKVEYKQEVETTEVETESETQFEVIFDRLIEYRKNDDVAMNINSTDDPLLAFDWENDEIIQSFVLGEQVMADFSEIMTSDDGIVSQFSVAMSDAGDMDAAALPVQMGFDFTVSRAAVGSSMSANKMKIDFRLDDFAWARKDTFVALVSTVESERKVKVEYEDDKGKGKEDDAETSDAVSATKRSGKSNVANDLIISFDDAVDVVGFTPFGEYSWAKTAEATSVVDTEDSGNMTDSSMTTTTAMARSGYSAETVQKTVMVVATSPSAGARRVLNTETGKTEQTQQIAFSFVGSGANGAKNLFWDPEAGIAYDNLSSSATTTQILVSGLISLAVMLFL